MPLRDAIIHRVSFALLYPAHDTSRCSPRLLTIIPIPYSDRLSICQKEVFQEMKIGIIAEVRASLYVVVCQSSLRKRCPNIERSVKIV